MATARNSDGGFVWPPGLETYDPGEWDCRVSWHLARARAHPSKRVKLAEIQMASMRPWLDEPGG